jgi:hypothetical protein
LAARDVIFKLKRELTRLESDRLLELIRAIPGVKIAAPVSRNVQSVAAKRLCFARVENPDLVQDIAAEVGALPGVSYAEVPPERKLA